jgi:hypothetical protein
MDLDEIYKYTIEKDNNINVCKSVYDGEYYIYHLTINNMVLINNKDQLVDYYSMLEFNKMFIDNINVYYEYNIKILDEL